MRYIDVIEELSNSEYLHRGDINKFSKEVLKIASNAIGCQRTNAWLFNKNQSILNSINSYDSLLKKFSKDNALTKSDLPNYFNFLTKNEIIISDDALSSDMNIELIDSYLLPNNIRSMIDVPIRSEGKMVGVICFEFVGKKYEWTASDQKFAQSVAQLFSLALETNKKRIYRNELEESIRQKEVLLYEINHRVKNNMAVIIGLINLQKYKSKDIYHETILEELKEKIYSMAIVQNHLHNNKSLVKVELSKYFEEVIYNLHKSYGHGKNIELNLELDKAVIDISIGIPLGLITNEVLTNSFKYAFNDKEKANQLNVALKRNNKEITIIFKDNGTGYDSKNVKEGMGMELIRDLSGQIGGELTIKQEGGVETQIIFSIKS